MAPPGSARRPAQAGGEAGGKAGEKAAQTTRQGPQRAWTMVPVGLLESAFALALATMHQPAPVPALARLSAR